MVKKVDVNTVKQNEKNNQSSVLESILSGKDENVLSYLYTDVYPKVRAMILSNNGQLDDAKDVFQDAVVVFYRYVKNGKFNEEKDISGFIYGVSRNLFYKLINKKSKNQNLDSVKELEDSSDIEKELITDEKETALHSLMHELGERCKELLMLSVFNKISMKEIAEKMGFANENAAKTGNYKCKQRLMKMIEKKPSLMQLFRG